MVTWYGYIVRGTHTVPQKRQPRAATAGISLDRSRFPLAAHPPPAVPANRLMNSDGRGAAEK